MQFLGFGTYHPADVSTSGNLDKRVFLFNPTSFALDLQVNLISLCSSAEGELLPKDGGILTKLLAGS